MSAQHQDLQIARDAAPAVPLRPASASDDPLFSLQPVQRWIRFCLDAARRHRLVALLTFLGAFALGGMALAGSPESYQTSTSVLLSGDRMLGAVEGSSYIASRQASAVITTTGSLDRYIDELGLIENKVEPPPFGQLRDSIIEGIFGEASEQKQREAMRRQLRQSILVFPQDGTASIDITVIWPDADQAAQIADLAFQVFFDERTRVEVEPFQEAVQIVSDRAEAADARVLEIRESLDLSPGDGAPAGSELEGAVRQQQELQSQLQTNEVALAEAQVGVRLRYDQLAPAEVPTAPVSGNLPRYLAAMVFAGIVTVGLLLFLYTPRGRIAAPWQLEKYQLPVIGPGDLLVRGSSAR